MTPVGSGLINQTPTRRYAMDIVDIFQKLITKRFSKKERVFVFLFLFLIVLFLAWAFNKGILPFGKKPLLTVHVPPSDLTMPAITPQKLSGESLLTQGQIRDPFARSIKAGGDGTKDSGLGNLKLSGIQLKADKPVYCLINDEIFIEGDRLAGRRIIRIEKDRVILKDDKGEYELKIWEE